MNEEKIVSTMKKQQKKTRISILSWEIIFKIEIEVLDIPNFRFQTFLFFYFLTMKNWNNSSWLQELKKAIENYFLDRWEYETIQNLYTDFFIDKNKKNKKIENLIENLFELKEDLDEFENCFWFHARLQEQKKLFDF